MELLLETVRLFFTCFDGVYARSSSSSVSEAATAGSQTRAHSSFTASSHSNSSTQVSAVPGKLHSGERERSHSSASPLNSGSHRTKLGHTKKAVSLDRDVQDTPPSTTQVTSYTLNPGNDGGAPAINTPDWSAVMGQLQATFTPAMAHATYIPFCQLLGQIKLNMELRNTDLIEQIAYSYDESVQEKGLLPSVFPSARERDFQLVQFGERGLYR